MKSGAGDVSISAPFNNAGTLALQATTLTLSGNGTHSGPITVASGATLSVTGGTHALGGNLTGAGTANFAGGTVTQAVGVTYGLPALLNTGAATTLNGTVVAPLDSIRVTGGTLTLTTDPALALAVGRVVQTGGTVTGPDTLAVSGSWQWSGGTLGTPVHLLGTATGTWTGTTLLEDRALLEGPVTWSGNLMRLQNTASVVNNATLTWTGAGAGTLDQGGGTNLFTNAGSFVKSGAGDVSISAPFNNTGTLDVQVGTLDFNGTFTHASGALLRGAGTVDLVGATVTFAGNLNPGTPGTVGTLSVIGNLTMAGTAQLITDVDAGSQDLLSVSGALTRGGALVANLINGFSPTTGFQYTAVTAGSPPGGTWTDPGGWTSGVAGNTVVVTRQ